MFQLQLQRGLLSYQPLFQIQGLKQQTFSQEECDLLYVESQHASDTGLNQSH